VVSGFTEILLEEYRDLPLETIEIYLTHISNASKNGNILLGNLLQWSRTQTGSITFEPIQLNLMLMAEETSNFLEGDAHKKNISIQLQIDPALNITADENMLKTILRNLLSNALKFTRENGNISVKASLSSDHVEICVSDSGVGIPEEKIPLLFRIETNSSTKGTSQESGSGLGLILCKEFVDKHHGKIWVETKVGIGSQFKFTLPLT
jgi:signal transduction histidine kinase